MKRIFVLLLVLISTSCAHKAEVRAPELFRGDHYSYVKAEDGRVYVFTTTTSHFDEAMKQLHPGPASVDKMDLYVITPLTQMSRPTTARDKSVGH